MRTWITVKDPKQQKLSFIVGCFCFVVVVQSLCRVQLCNTNSAACQASLSFTISCSFQNSCPLNQWCHPTISTVLSTFSPALIFPSIRVFFSESVLHIIWPKYWSFSFSIRPSKEYSGLISFKIDFLISLQSKGLSRIFNITVESVRSLVLNLPYGPTLTSIHDYWKNHRFNYTDLCWQSNVSAS